MSFRSAAPTTFIVLLLNRRAFRVEKPMDGSRQSGSCTCFSEIQLPQSEAFDEKLHKDAINK